jgi:hypothetical protein
MRLIKNNLGINVCSGYSIDMFKYWDCVIYTDEDINRYTMILLEFYKNFYNDNNFNNEYNKIEYLKEHMVYNNVSLYDLFNVNLWLII